MTCRRIDGRSPIPTSRACSDFYAFGPEAPANARALSPEALDGWLATTIDATPMLREWNPAGIRVQEARGHRALVVLLASELYRRDHGTDAALRRGAGRAVSQGAPRRRPGRR